MTTKVMMVPHADVSFYHGESGIKTLVAKYFQHLPKYDVELVGPNDDSFDVLAIHAGMTNNFGAGVPIVAHIHGLYWTADYPSYHWQHKANASVTDTMRHAKLTTVPSEWVAETLRRDMHIDPIVLRHGIDWQDWQHDYDEQGYVLWNKNRMMDVCSPMSMNMLAQRRPNVKFLSTFTEKNPTPNIKVTGVVKHEKMREYVQRAGVYLATTKETFGIGTLEAMASGVPVLGFNHGGTAGIVKHGQTGYLARVGDFDDLAIGLDYCIANRATLGRNAIAEVKRKYGWDEVCKELAELYEMAPDWDYLEDSVSVVIPVYNKERSLERAVVSVLRQTRKPLEIFLVDNNSTDGSKDIANKLAAEHENILAFNCHDQGVAHARNLGVAQVSSAYVCCLDADDEIEPEFLEVCVKELNSDARLGLAYTKLRAIDKNGQQQVSAWPDEYDYDEFLRKKNQVPTCCVFQTRLWSRLGGYRQRYAPRGAGSEDAEFWLRMGAAGYGGKLASKKALFNYHLGGQVSGDPAYKEVDWLAWHPWVEDAQHPFASAATPANGISHLVRQYDQPVISVIIPCSSGHLRHVHDALDSLEAQTYHKWEVIVVVDGHEKGICWTPQHLRDAHPFVRWISLDKNYGPGHARNRGADAANAPLLLFLDADDWLTPRCLELMLQSHEDSPDSIIYTDYYAHSTIEDSTEIKKLQVRDRLKVYDPMTNEATVYHKSLPYDCIRAQAQPNVGDMYIWNLITSLVPRKFHRAIGGFDESMRDAWEDWDYWLRMSHRGYCFTYLTHPLVEYRFATGTRRAAANPEESGDDGRQLGQSLIQYLLEKYEGVEKMGCGGCSKHRAMPVERPIVPLSHSLNEGAVREMSSSDLVWVQLDDGNIGSHPISLKGTSYGYRSSGERFKMFRPHAELDKRVRIVEPDMLPKTIEDEEPEELSPPEENFVEWGHEDFVGGGEIETEDEAEEEFDPAGTYVEFVDNPQKENLTKIWGVNDERALIFDEAGAELVQHVAKLDVDVIMEWLNVSTTIAKRIKASAEKLSK